MWNWKNVAENLLLVLISMSLGVIVGAFVAVKVADIVLDNQKSIIETAIKKETTAINNNVITEIRKIKSKGSEPINIIIDPNTNSVISNKDTTQVITVQEKKGFFKRLFSKKENINTNNQ